MSPNLLEWKDMYIYARKISGPKIALKNDGGHSTMCDFHNFCLIFEGQMHCLPQRLKSTLFEIFSNGGCPKGTWSVEKISWAYFVTFSSETKIMKITHSALLSTALTR